MEFIENPIPETGPVRIIRDRIESIHNVISELRIVQHGGETFRLHVKNTAVTLSPADALWIIDKFKLGCKKSPLGLRRVVIWSAE